MFLLFVLYRLLPVIFSFVRVLKFVNYFWENNILSIWTNYAYFKNCLKGRDVDRQDIEYWHELAMDTGGNNKHVLVDISGRTELHWAYTVSDL